MEIPFKRFVPTAERKLPILRGPLRGGKFYASPRSSLRKVFGIFEHELNPWLHKAVKEVHALLDVGAADGYYTFGIAAAFERAGKLGKIFCFEPEAHFCALLNQSAAPYRQAGHEINVIQKLVGNVEGRPDMMPLSNIEQSSVGNDVRTLIKIDVEGAEIDVLESGGHWLNPRNLFLVEVHAEPLIPAVIEILAAHGVSLEMVEQKPHWLLGRERRSPDNRWLVSSL